VDIATFLKTLEATALATKIREALFIFPMLEATHVIGLAVVFGTIAIIDLRLIGLASSQRSFKRMYSDILKWTWGAFALTALTGALMFITNATVYYHNFYFRMKMLLLVLAALNMGAFELTLGRRVESWDKAPSAPPLGRVVGVLSIALWITVIFMGRMIGFTTTRAAVVAPPSNSVNFDDFLNTPGPPPAPPKK
jgi:hypothetical protein